jgi:urease accessory protein
MRNMSWKAELELDYRLDGGRVRAVDRHHGPLRVLKALPLPQGLGCEHVLVHPPGGLAAGDELRVRLHQGRGTRVRVTTPGATRLYRSTGAWAEQDVQIEVEDGALLEWLPLETLAYGGCRARSAVRARLQPGALMVGWDVACLGLPAAADEFAHGRFEQHLEVQGAWLERAVLDAQDQRLRRSPLGLDGQPVWASMWCASGSAWPESQRQALVEAAQGLAPGLQPRFGVTSPGPQVVVVRALASRVEPVFDALRRVRHAWLPLLGHEVAGEPRVWST